MERLVGAAATIGTTKGRGDGDMVDRLNYRYTVFVLILFSIVVSTKHYTGDPIICWCPAEFTDNHLDFAAKYCWVSNTYYVPVDQKIIPDEKRIHIGYYQWVPLILLAQAFLFYMPVMFWRVASNNAGVEITNIVNAVNDLQHGRYSEQRAVLLRIIVLHLDRYLTTVQDKKGATLGRLKYCGAKCFLFRGRRYGNNVTAMYLVMKLLHFVNIFVQFLILNAFLGDGYHLYGIEIIKKLIYTHDWGTSERFPRVTLCDFNIRKPGNIQTHTVQCVLQINLFNEKIYIFIWFWYTFVAILTAINFFIWLYRVFYYKNKINYVKHLLKSVIPNLPKQEKRGLKQFVFNYLKYDGLLVLRIVGANGNDLVVAEMLRDLWILYKTRHGLSIAVDPSLPNFGIDRADKQMLNIV